MASLPQPPTGVTTPPNNPDVPDGWFVVNPRHMTELKAALSIVERVRRVADAWRDAPICGTTGAHEEELREALDGVR